MRNDEKFLDFFSDARLDIINTSSRKISSRADLVHSSKSMQIRPDLGSIQQVVEYRSLFQETLRSLDFVWLDFSSNIFPCPFVLSAWIPREFLASVVVTRN